MIHRFLLIFIFAFVTAKPCFSEDYCKLSNRIVSQYSFELKKTKNLCLIGSGGAMMHDIKEIMVHYATLATLTVPEARILYVEVAKEYLKRINQNERIRPYLHNYPFTFSNFDLRISLEDENGNIRDDGHVAFVYQGKNQTIHYDAYKNGQFQELHREPYSEALKIVYGETSTETTSPEPFSPPCPDILPLPTPNTTEPQKNPPPLNTHNENHND